jgi:hypothetical protein
MNASGAIMDSLSKRDLAALVVGGIALVALTIWGTIIVLDRFVRFPSDPLVKAGGLKQEQMIQAK